MKKRREVDVGAPLADWLRDMGWRVYPEVEVFRSGHVADVVATRGPLVWIIECKTSLSLALLDQVVAWQGFAHMRSIAIPDIRTRCGDAARRMLRADGVGLLRVGESEWGIPVREDIPARIDRRARLIDNTRKALHPDHEQWATPGQVSAKGCRLTPFALTCRGVRGFVEGHPGCSMKDLVEGVKHHYASDNTARSTLARWIQRGIVPGVRAERDGRRVRCFADAA